MQLLENVRRIRLRRDYRAVFGTDAGQRVLNDLLAFSGFAKDALVPNDPQATGYQLGMRRVALRVLSFLHLDEADLARRAMQVTTDEESHD